MFSVLQAKGQFKKRSTANDVEIFVPVPADADTPKHRVRDYCYSNRLGEGAWFKHDSTNENVFIFCCSVLPVLPSMPLKETVWFGQSNLFL